tara:strand:+ start:105 stop:854 length:750 start_codon:yes stop_codon:yes gene_type:complete
MEQKQQFPTENVTLPSKGLLYPEDSPLRSGTIEMKYMTAREEDILTNQNYIAKGTVIDKLLQSLIVTPNVKYNEILLGDKNAILIAARVLGYGADYTFEYMGNSYTIDLAEVEDKEIDESLLINGKNEIKFTLPTSKIDVTFKLLTHLDEKNVSKEIEGLKKFDKNSERTLSTRLKYQLLSVNGDYEKKTIRNFVDNIMLARDSRAFRNYLKEIQPDIDLTFEHIDGAGKSRTLDVPIGVQFFWPDADL